MTNSEDIFEVYAIKYATRYVNRNEYFFGYHEVDEQYSLPMDYYVWVATSTNQTIVIDTGFTAEVSKKRERTYLRSPTETLKLLGVDVNSVPLVILTHMHYDHIGNIDKFPNATFVIQEDEMSFWTGRYASKDHFKSVVEEDDIAFLVRKNLNGNVRFVKGSEEIVPGVSVHLVGGHSAGLQVLKIKTKKGNVILASDAAHYYFNLIENKPFSVVHDLPKMYYALEVLNSLVDSKNLIIPGHDPKLMNLYPPARPGLEGMAVRIA
jgi:glyoxylase-like metal-dependent hydrolase (beta-lactamase superfamily II)